VSLLGLGAAVLLASQNIDTRAQAQTAASNAQRMTTGNPITGEGLPNPAPVVIRNWGQLPAGRKWGTTAGIDVDPIDGNIWPTSGVVQERPAAPVVVPSTATTIRSILSSSSIARPARCSRTSARASW
jgi:hypothetical protein